MAGVRVVRSFGLEQAELERFERSNQSYLERGLVLARLRGSMWPVMQGVTTLGVLIVFWYGGFLIVGGELKAEEFLPFYRALYRLTWPLAALGFLVSVVQRGRAGYQRLAEVFAAEPDVVDGTKPLASVRGALEVRDLSFAYGAIPVLKGVNFSVAPGECVAIVGRTAAGKSTLGALMTRLQSTPKQSIFLDGTDICDLPLNQLRSAVLYLQQTPFLFSTTVGRNIAYALPEPDSATALQAVRDASQQAQIRPEIESLPEGFDTVVGERGVQLSGGQKQRTALARSFVTWPQVLILDDPLSALDARTESALLDSLDRKRAGHSLILITHRVSAAARCDRIVVLDAGRVVDQGTHAELAARDGLYRRFVEEQQREQELEHLGRVNPAQLGALPLAGGLA
jgi:ATP-binding cassette, subfamily B, multidrug efflux pump